MLEKYRPNDVYNANKTGLYYRATPDSSLCYCETLSGSKKAMQRITVLCCLNVTGTDKCKLLVIGKSIKPQCFKNIDVGSLPVTHRANKNAWMASQLFTEWLTEWDSCLDRENWKILLLVDNCTGHPKEHPIRVSATQHHFTYPTNGSGNHPKFGVFLSKRNCVNDPGILGKKKFSTHRKAGFFILLPSMDDDDDEGGFYLRHSR